MFRDLVDRIAELAVAAKLPHVISTPAEPSHHYAIALPDGSVVEREAEPMPRRHSAADLSAIIACAGRALVNDDSEPTAEIWYSRKAVMCYLDPATRRDTITLPLTLSPQVRILQGIEAAVKSFTQQQFLSLLRISLANAAPAALLAAVRQLKFRVNQGGDSSIEHGRKSIGRSLEAELTGAGTIPEEVTLCVPVFEGFLAHRTFNIGCAIEIYPETSALSLHPLPGEIEGAIRQAEAEIGDELRHALEDHDVPVLYGTP